MWNWKWKPFLTFYSTAITSLTAYTALLLHDHTWYSQQPKRINIIFPSQERALSKAIHFIAGRARAQTEEFSDYFPSHHHSDSMILFFFFFFNWKGKGGLLIIDEAQSQPQYQVPNCVYIFVCVCVLAYYYARYHKTLYSCSLEARHMYCGQLEKLKENLNRNRNELKRFLSPSKIKWW